MQKFQNDLKKGKKAEDYVCNFLQQFFHDAKVFDGYKKEWDIEIPSISTHVEVKYDRLSKKTGNVAIEVEYYGKPSGIKTTTAEVWCIIFYNQNKWYTGFIKVEKLSSLCDDRKIVFGGDELASRMALLPVSELIKNCKHYAIDY